MQGFVKAASLKEILPGKCKALELNGLKIVLVNQGGSLYALEDACTHLGAPLSQGFLSKDCITCEWHGASFDLRTGEALSAPAREPLRTFELRLSGDDIEVLI
ncbi:MAG: non-heme iron oxygenase ferredoxin subunit [Candidatus Obscuribacterales bacterium]|nr:non-heme iron oxygenase ferredoxin subunit [Candidatus Obscuribacterales bacterium]